MEMVLLIQDPFLQAGGAGGNGRDVSPSVIQEQLYQTVEFAGGGGGGAGDGPGGGSAGWWRWWRKVVQLMFLLDSRNCKHWWWRWWWRKIQNPSLVEQVVQV